MKNEILGLVKAMKEQFGNEFFFNEIFGSLLSELEELCGDVKPMPLNDGVVLGARDYLAVIKHLLGNLEDELWENDEDDYRVGELIQKIDDFLYE